MMTQDNFWSLMTVFGHSKEFFFTQSVAIIRHIYFIILILFLFKVCCKSFTILKKY